MDTSNLWKEGTFTQVPNLFLGEIIKDRSLSPAGIRIKLFISRLTNGFNNRRKTFPLSVSEISKTVGISISQTSKELKRLLESGRLFRGEKKGRSYRYSNSDVFSSELSSQSSEVSTEETKVSLQSTYVDPGENSEGSEISLQESSESSFSDGEGKSLNLGEVLNKDLNKERNKNESSFSSFPEGQNQSLVSKGGKKSVKEIPENTLRMQAEHSGIKRLKSRLIKEGYDEGEVNSVISELVTEFPYLEKEQGVKIR